MPKLHRAWVVCIGCALLLFCTSGLVTNAFSIYLPYILDYNGFTNAQTSFLLTARSFASFITMFLTGIYYKKLSLKKGMGLAGLLTALGFLIYGLAKSYPVYILGAIIAGAGYGFGTMVPIGIILNLWFESNLSTATGLCASVTGISTLGLPTLITVLIEKIGLGETFALEALLILIMTIIGYMCLSNSPKEAGCQPYRKLPLADGPIDGSSNMSGASSIDASAGLSDEKPEKPSKAAKKVYRPVLHGKLWLLFFVIMLFIGGYTGAVYCHLSIIMTGEGISTADASLVILVSGIAITASKFVYGFCVDRLSTPIANLIFGTLVVLGLIICVLTRGNTLLMGSGIVIYSFGLGMTTVGLVSWAKDLSRPEDFDRNNRISQVGYSGGSLMFSPLLGIIADHSNGSYMPAIIFFTVLAFISLLVIQTVYHRASVK